MKLNVLKNGAFLALAVFFCGISSAFAEPCTNIADAELKRLELGTFYQPSPYTNKETLGTRDASGDFTPSDYTFRSGMKSLRYTEYRDVSVVFAVPGLRGSGSAVSLSLDKSCKIIQAVELFTTDGRSYFDTNKSTTYGVTCNDSSLDRLSEDVRLLCAQYKQFMLLPSAEAQAGRSRSTSDGQISAGSAR